MPKLIASVFVTLDGVMESPERWSLQYWSDDIAKVKHDELFTSDALLLGRVTYEGFAAAWPTMSDDTGFADRMNGLPKYVVSTTLQSAEWNNSTIIADNVVDEVKKLKKQDGQDILIGGSGELINALARHGLIDEFRLLVYPVVLGSGKRLFKESTTASLQLLETREAGSGVVLQRYAAAS